MGEIETRPQANVYDISILKNYVIMYVCTLEKKNVWKEIDQNVNRDCLGMGHLNSFTFFSLCLFIVVPFSP